MTAQEIVFFFSSTFLFFSYFFLCVARCDDVDTTTEQRLHVDKSREDSKYARVCVCLGSVSVFLCVVKMSVCVVRCVYVTDKQTRISSLLMEQEMQGWMKYQLVFVCC